MEKTSSLSSNAWLFAAITVGILGLLTVLGGLPPQDQMLPFVAGAAIMIAITVGIGLLGWHLLARPMPAQHKHISWPILSGWARHLAALFMVLGVTSIAIGSVWDEVWHSEYGIPFGEDFFWRPHIMMYFGFTVVIVMAGWGWFSILRSGQGSLQQRFRADPVMGFTILAGTFLVYALPADPLWHAVYGEDITSWSLPHIVLLLMVMVIAIAAVALQSSLQSVREWSIVRGIGWRDGLIALALVSMLLTSMLLLTVDWYGQAIGAVERSVVAERPDWLLTSMIMGVAVLVALIGVHATRTVGFATLLGLLAVAGRLFLDNVLSTTLPGVNPLLVALPLMIAVDVWHGLWLRYAPGLPPFWSTALVLTAVLSIFSLPLVHQLFIYPTVDVQNAPMMLVAGLLTALIIVWMGQQVGGALASIERVESTEPLVAPRLRWADALIYVIFVVFTIFFIMTATPPIA